jgi:hypothetical protein
MVQVFKDFQTLLDDGMAFEALDVRHKAHTASVMLVLARVQTVLFKMLDFSSRGHASSPSMEASKNSRVGSIVQCNNNANQNKWGQIPFVLIILGAGIKRGQI